MMPCAIGGAAKVEDLDAWICISSAQTPIIVQSAMRKVLQ